MPDLIGHLTLPQGRDCRSVPAMTVFVMPDLIGHLAPHLIVMPDLIGHLMLPAMTREFADEPRQASR